MGEDRKPVEVEKRIIVTFYKGDFPAKITITNTNGDVLDDFYLPKGRAAEVGTWVLRQRARTRG